MKMVFKQLIILSAVVLLVTACSKTTKSLPGVHEMSEESYVAYDETVISGQQVDTALNRYKESLAIIVVKDGLNYIFGDKNAAEDVAGESKIVAIADKEKVIDREGTYKSLVLRDSNNAVIGIQLIEWKK